MNTTFNMFTKVNEAPTTHNYDGLGFVCLYANLDENKKEHSPGVLEYLQRINWTKS